MCCLKGAVGAGLPLHKGKKGFSSAQLQLLPKSGVHMTCPGLPAVPPTHHKFPARSKWPQLITPQNLGFLICEKKITTSPEIRGCVETQARSSEPQAGSTGPSGQPLSLRGQPAWGSFSGACGSGFLTTKGMLSHRSLGRGQIGWEPKPHVWSKDRQGEDAMSVEPGGKS